MSPLNLSKISFWVWWKPGKKYCFRSCILKWNHSSISIFTKCWWGVESSLKRAYYWKMATKLLKAQSQIHEWEEGGSNHPFNSSYAYWMMKKEATLKWFIWPKCDRSSLCSCDLLPHLSVLSLFACLVKNKWNVSHLILALFLFSAGFMGASLLLYFACNSIKSGQIKVYSTKEWTSISHTRDSNTDAHARPPPCWFNSCGFLRAE